MTILSSLTSDQFSLVGYFLNSIQQKRLNEIKMLLNVGFISSYFRNCDPKVKDKFGRNSLHLAWHIFHIIKSEGWVCDNNIADFLDFLSFSSFNKYSNILFNKDDSGRTVDDYAKGSPWEDAS